MTTSLPTDAHSSRVATLGKRRFAIFWLPVALVLASFVMVGTVAANHSKTISPIDEWVYLDYLFKFPSQGIVHQGEKVGPEARALIACNDVRNYGHLGPQCGGDYSDLSKFPYNGITSAGGYTPAFFAVTWSIGSTIHAVTGIDLVKSWRLVGAFWLAFAMVLFTIVMRGLRAPPLLTLGLGLAFIASPFSWWTYTYVSTDAPSAAFGMLLLLAAQRFLQRRWSGWWLVGLSALAVAFKGTNILAVCFAALYLLIVWLIRWRQARRAGTLRPKPLRSQLSVLGFGVAAVFSGVIVQGIWQVLQKALAVGPKPEQGVSHDFTVSGFIGQFLNFLPNTITSGAGSAGGNLYTTIAQPLSWICIASVLAAFFGLRRWYHQRALIATTSIASVLFGPLLLAVLSLSDYYFDLPARYGSPIVLAFLLMAAIVIRNRWAIWGILTYSSALFVTVLITAPIFAP